MTSFLDVWRSRPFELTTPLDSGEALRRVRDELARPRHRGGPVVRGRAFDDGRLELYVLRGYSRSTWLRVLNGRIYATETGAWLTGQFQAPAEVRVFTAGFVGLAGIFAVIGPVGVALGESPGFLAGLPVLVLFLLVVTVALHGSVVAEDVLVHRLRQALNGSVPPPAGP